MAETSADEDDQEQDEFDEQLHVADEEDTAVSPEHAIERTARIEDGDQPAPTEVGAATDDWRSEFERVEEAWLDGRIVGDPHEALNFLHLLVDLHMEDLESSVILEAFDRFRARAGGKRFSYCPLHGAVHLVQMRKPSLDNGLVLVRYRELARLPPCKGLDDCPWSRLRRERDPDPKPRLSLTHARTDQTTSGKLPEAEHATNREGVPLV